MDEILIRPLFPSDLAAAAEIEATAQDAWSKEQILDELCSDAGRLFVAQVGLQVAGLAIFQLAAGEASLYAITIDPAMRRKGLGRRLLQESLESLQKEGAESCYLEVRAQNHAAQNLYIDRGFQRTGLRQGFYKNPADDAVLMQYRF